MPTWSAGVRMGLATMPSKVRPPCPAPPLPDPRGGAQVPRQVRGWFLAEHDEAGALT